MIHAKQFIISKKQYNGPDFLHIQLSDGYTLSCHKDLEVFCLERSSILLLGIAWQADPLRPAPAVEMEELAEKYDGAIPEERILRMEESWCGRYVLIVQGRVYLDASGLLGIFYSKTGISSSCSLLADSMGAAAAILYLLTGYELASCSAYPLRTNKAAASQPDLRLL